MSALQKAAEAELAHGRTVSAVVSRARGDCEAACGRRGAEVDHFFGRAKAEETAANCWLLCRECHRAKTDNAPSAVNWLEKFVVHCAIATLKDDAHRMAYFEAMDRAMTKLATQRAKFQGEK